MAELPIRSHNLTPDSPGGRDGFRWHVGLDVDGDETQLVVDVSESQAIETQLSRADLHARLPHALQRYAAGKLRTDLPVLDQVASWNSPVVLRARALRLRRPTAPGVGAVRRAAAASAAECAR